MSQLARRGARSRIGTSAGGNIVFCSVDFQGTANRWATHRPQASLAIGSQDLKPAPTRDRSGRRKVDAPEPRPPRGSTGEGSRTESAGTRSEDTRRIPTGDHSMARPTSHGCDQVDRSKTFSAVAAPPRVLALESSNFSNAPPPRIEQDPCSAAAPGPAENALRWLPVPRRTDPGTSPPRFRLLQV